jgi:hypothetical protein
MVIEHLITSGDRTNPGATLVMSDLPPIQPDPEPVPAQEPLPPQEQLPAQEPVSPTLAKKAGWRSWAAAGGVAAVVLVGGVVATRHQGTSTPDAVQASSATPGQGGAGGPGQGFASRGAQGTIASISGTTFAVDSTDRTGATSTVTVTTGDATTYTDAVAGQVSDLALGDTVLVRGTDTNGAVTATSVTEGATISRGGAGGATPPTGTGYGPPAGFTPPNGGTGQPGQGGPGGGGGFTAGSILSVDGDAFTVKAADGTQVVVTTTSATTVTVTKRISFADLKKGDAVQVIGTRTGDKVAATSVRRGQLGGFGGPGRGAGTSTTTSSS